MNAGDPDDEAAMAYFLPNGIADDSPPKPTASSRFAPSGSSFGPIGTPSSASSTSFFGPSMTPTGSSPAVQEFAPVPSLLRPSVLDHSPFRSTPDSSSAGSPQQGSYLLSDLGGEIHEPSRASELRDTSASDSSSSAVRAGFGFPGSLRSPSSRMFDDGGRGLPLTRARNFTGTPRSLSGLGADRDFDSFGDRPMRTSSSSFDMGTVVTSTGFGSVSPNTSLTFGTSSEDSLFSTPPIRNWTSHGSSSIAQPRKVLSTPPGLSPPSRKDIDNSLSQLSRESGGMGSAATQRVHANQASMSAPSYDPFGSAAINAGSIGSFGNIDPRQFGPPSAHIGSHLTGLSMSHDVFGATSPPRLDVASIDRGRVPNRELAELNTQSVKMDDVIQFDSIESDSSPTRTAWQDTSSARRIEVQSKTKSERNQQQPARQRGRTETSLEISGGSPLSLNRSAAKLGTSPLQPIAPSDSRKSTTSPTISQGSTSPGVAVGDTAARVTDEKPTSGKNRRRQNASTPESTVAAATSSYAVIVGGGASIVSDAGAKKITRGLPSQSDVNDASTSKTTRESIKSKRREPAVDTKSSVNLAITPKKILTKPGTEKSSPSVLQPAPPSASNTSVTRRQIYREKQKPAAKDSEEKNGPESGQLSSTPDFLDEKSSVTKPASDGPNTESKSDAKSRRRRQKEAKEEMESRLVGESSLKKESIEETALPQVQDQPGAAKTTFADVIASSTSKTQIKSGSSPSKSSATHARSKVSSNSTASMAPTSNSTEVSDVAPASGVATATQTGEHLSSIELEREQSSIVVSNDGSSSDVDKAQLSTDDEYEMTSNPHPHSEDATSADEASHSGTFADGPRGSSTMRKTDKVSKKNAAKDRKERQKKEKLDRKKSSKSKKDKRLLPSGLTHGTDQPDELLASLPAELNRPSPSSAFFGTFKSVLIWLASVSVSAIVKTVGLWKLFVERANLKVALSTSFSYVESVLAVVFSVILLLALHGASWFIRIHRIAFRALLSHRHIGFCFAFLYGFPALVQHVFPWAPPWAPVCLWYAFLVQLFCTNGSTAMVTTFRIILPLVFLVEGISHHSFLLDLNGAELLLTSFILSALKTSNLCSPIFFMSLAAQCLLAVFLGSELVVQWVQLAIALYSLHLLASTEDWVGFGDDDDDMAYHHHQQQQQHSIADYSHHPAPSGAVSIQKTKRLDRRALAYVRGRKFR